MYYQYFSFVSLVKFNVNCAMAVLALLKFDWRQFDCWCLSREAILLTHIDLLNILNFTTIGCDLQVNWNWFLFLLKRS